MNTIYMILKQETILEVTFPNPSLYEKETETQRGDINFSKSYSESENLD